MTRSRLIACCVSLVLLSSTPTRASAQPVDPFDFRERAEKSLPVFRGDFPKAKLPQAPFGLDFSRSKVTAADLKELAALNNLCSLCLAKTPVTDASLKELAGLKGLAAAV